MSPLPLGVDGVTPEWLTEALSVWHPDTRVAAIEEQTLIWGSATKVLVRVRYDRVDDRGPPARLCVKAGFHEELRTIAGEAYCTEANFYTHIGRIPNLPAPRCWFAHAEPERLQGIVILADLTEVGAKFGEPTEPWSVAQVARGLDSMARWHAPTWGATLTQYSWLPKTCSLRGMFPWLFGAENWARTMQETFSEYIPASLRDPQRIERACARLWARDDGAQSSIAHYDPHMGNAYVIGDSAPRFLDWQCVHIAPPAHDVAYFLVGALGVENRRRHERELVRGYLDALHRHGGPKLDEATFWEDYRRHHLHGFIWALATPDMQPIPRLAVMTERHCAAIVDHDSLRLLEEN